MPLRDPSLARCRGRLEWCCPSAHVLRCTVGMQDGAAFVGPQDGAAERIEMRAIDILAMVRTSSISLIVRARCSCGSNGSPSLISCGLTTPRCSCRPALTDARCVAVCIIEHFGKKQMNAEA